MCRQDVPNTEGQVSQEIEDKWILVSRVNYIFVIPRFKIFPGLV
jgi:hypothetical protein